MRLLTGEELGDAAQLACLLEVSAPKPGNVSRYRDFEDLRFEDFVASAVAVGAAIRAAGRASVGETVWQAISRTRRMVRTNTNLGIVLLLAPLARAYGEGEWRSRLRGVLDALTVRDAQDVYRAIRLAAPAGMGRIPEGDIAEEPHITLLQAMGISKDWDSIAREYVTGFEITFELTYPGLQAQLADGMPLTEAVVQTYLVLLSEVPDTFIARKNGQAAAEEVAAQAREALRAGGMRTPEGRRQIEQLDHALRVDGHRLNPGTSADLITAALFMYLVERRLEIEGL